MMDSIELKARAKINLSLDVLKRQPDGYHQVRMIMQTIALHDRVLITKTDGGIHIACNSRWVPSSSENIAYKACELVLNRYGIKSGLNIVIDKKIPVAAGLAGGSTDAAAVLKGMNAVFSLGLGQAELMALGKEIGADVPFCIKGGTVLSEGIGEILTALDPLNGMNIVLVKPPIGVSTAWVYKNLDLGKIEKRPDTNLLLHAVKQGDIRTLAGNMGNVLETVTIEKHAIIKRVKDRLMELGALGSMMSGSGPSVFGVFADKKSALYAYETVKKSKWDCFMTESICEEM